MIQRWNLKLRRRPLTTQRPSGGAPRLQEPVESGQIAGTAFLVARDGVTLPLKAVGNQSLESKVEAAVNGIR